MEQKGLEIFNGDGYADYMFIISGYTEIYYGNLVLDTIPDLIIKSKLGFIQLEMRTTMAMMI